MNTKEREMSSHQDWKPVEIGRGRASKVQKEETAKKISQYVPSTPGMVEDEDGEKIVKFSREFIQAVISARVEKKWDQKRLASEMRYKPDFIKRFEQGKEIYDSKVVSLFKKKLNIHVEAKAK